jgi:hypothetical protein
LADDGLKRPDVNSGQKPRKSGGAKKSGTKIAGLEPGQGRAPARRSKPLTRRKDGYAGHGCKRGILALTAMLTRAFRRQISAVSHRRQHLMRISSCSGTGTVTVVPAVRFCMTAWLPRCLTTSKPWSPSSRHNSLPEKTRNLTNRDLKPGDEHLVVGRVAISEGSAVSKNSSIASCRLSRAFSIVGP